MHIPVATYRLQFNSDFGFRAAKKIIPYLAELGISTVYASPIFSARKGSTHGYDVTDPNRLNGELGTSEDFDDLIETVHQHGMGWLQDFVPNHMAYDSRNWMLMDVFEKGRASAYFGFFDIVWDHIRENLRGKVIAPFLGSPYGETLEKGELTVEYRDGTFRVKYYETTYPISIKSYATVIGHGLGDLRARLGRDHPGYVRALGITTVLKNLPREPAPQDVEASNAQMILAKEWLRDLYQKDDVIRRFIDGNVSTFNEDAGLLDALLSEQWFQFTYWRVATKEVNYQRFFNINELISLRMEDEEVFRHVHRLVLGLLKEGKIDGLRIDHIDGLYDPAAYLARLREEAGDAFIIVEKILESSERLPPGWPVEGTTGYDFMNYANGLFVDGRGGEAFQGVYSRFTGHETGYRDLLYEKKKLIIERHLTGDLDNLTSLLKTLSTTARDAIDLPWELLMDAIAETAAEFPVYRTYVAGPEITEQDRAYIRAAVERARERNPALDRALGFLEAVLLLDFPEYLAGEHKGEWLSFAMRFQQFTSPLMAKGLEDTTFYVFNRLTSLNEVGGDPGRFGVSPAEFHSFAGRRRERHPHTLNATATHDTKRGEDTRVRIDVLSEMPGEWEMRLARWGEQNGALKKVVGDQEVPGRNREYFLYQTLAGAFTHAQEGRADFIKRVKDYMLKSAREAKSHTFWLDNNLEYEQALVEFTEKILAPAPSNQFLKDFMEFQKVVAHYAVFGSLSQTLLKIASPGLPDFYQGSELWDLSLVDPDNRRPVDYEKHERLLTELKRKEESGLLSLIEELFSDKDSGRVKLFTIRRALDARRRHKELFDHGDYAPLTASGNHGRHVVAFARRKDNQWAIAVAPRLLTSLIAADELPLGDDVWRDTVIKLPADSPASWRQIFTGQSIAPEGTLHLAEVFRHFPIGLLIGE
ncbi:MAG: malto-oligosyltrehalose synthase [Blastocatellia bacterium]